MAMALRSLVTRMRTPAAALRHLPPPPPAAGGTRRRGLYYATKFADRSQSLKQGPSREDARKLYLENLEEFNSVMEHKDYMMPRIKLLERGNKLLKWSFVLLVPFPLASAFVRAVK